VVTVAGLEQMLLDQVRDDFSVGFGGELVAFFDQLFLEAEIVFDDAIVHHHDLPGAVAMRVRVFFGGTPVRGPTGMADAVSALERLDANGLFQVAQLAFRAPHLQLVAVARDCDSSRVIAAVFQPPQAINNDGNHFLLADITNNSTHGNSRNSLCEGAAKFFDYRVGEHFARNALQFRLRLFAAEPAIECQLKIFSLADLFQAFIAHLLKRPMDRLSLRIEDALLQRNVDVGFHGKINYT